MSIDPISPELILAAYGMGVFPMAESQESDEVAWISPDERGIIPIEDFHTPKRLARTIRNATYNVTRDQDFTGVIDGCANRGETTWINDHIRGVFIELHDMGHAHSVEVRDDDDALIGGLYGLAMGGAFIGESMFSRQRDASKIALAYLVDHLKERGFVLLDAQFENPHLAQFGAEVISREDYLTRLSVALTLDVTF